MLGFRPHKLCVEIGIYITDSYYDTKYHLLLNLNLYSTVMNLSTTSFPSCNRPLIEESVPLTGPLKPGIDKIDKLLITRQLFTPIMLHGDTKGLDLLSSGITA